MIYLIELKRDVAGRKTGDLVKASMTAIEAHGLQRPRDYMIKGSYGAGVESELPEDVEVSAEPEIADTTE